ncbi:TPA: hypothetical protein DEO28_00710 [Candidatus Dependentiae bacterium]|nr:MAG: hypothetical protein UR14_C0001G0008 [candidate division TM6 bacterium GW2011_GWE2_31_21]KKP54112.1 MAG: hypothetical protein UR43_C0001G0130 [candidate division TM6 bacterium GW2011_GWF2_33_332]HBS48306.1 hypothetical protein [Candidatus Dependentiae bacterium]HBZ73020.1 hypothetical protein [Candidatus Dependentiae bacterium]
MKFNKILLTALAFSTICSLVVAKNISVTNNTNRTVTSLRIKAKDGEHKIVKKYQNIAAEQTIVAEIPDTATVKKIRADLPAINANEIARIGQDKSGQTKEQKQIARRDKFVTTAREKDAEILNGTSFSIQQKNPSEISENRHLFKIVKTN